MQKPRRGEIWLIDLGYVAKVRPALVLSIDFTEAERAVITFVPRTTAVRGTRFEVQHVAAGFDAGVFDAQGISGVPLAKLIRKMAIADAPTLAAVEEAVRRWLGFV